MTFDIGSIPSQEGKIAIVTGANNGVGFETTVGLASKGFNVIMACRSLPRAENAKTDILKRLPGANLDIIELDLSKQESVHDFAAKFRDKYNRLDVLINNAGVLDYSGRTNEAGLELQLVINYLGHFALTSLLLDLMPDDPSSRIVSLSSIAHKQGKIAFNDLNCEHQKDKGFAYAQSKLACLVFSDELHRRLNRSGKRFLSTCAHPGGTDSGLFDDMPRIQYFTLKALAPFITHSNKDAAKPSLLAALSDQVQGGDYWGPQGFMDLKGPPGPAKRTEYSMNPEVGQKLWEVSEQLTGIHFEI